MHKNYFVTERVGESVVTQLFAAAHFARLGQSNVQGREIAPAIVTKERNTMISIKQKLRVGISVFAVSGTALTLLAPMSMAGGPQLSVSQTSAPAGTSVDVSGNCYGDAVVVGLYPGTISGNDPAEVTSIVDERITLDGSNWNWTMNIPADTEAGEYTVNAECQSEGETPPQNVPFRVEAAQVTTSTTVAPTTTMAPTTEIPAPVAPATAVQARPTFTG